MEDIKEKTADEMFDELGFSKSEIGKKVIYATVYICVEFDSSDEMIVITNKISIITFINKKILQAINKKCLELRLVRR